jgi:hypothetical protein
VGVLTRRMACLLSHVFAPNINIFLDREILGITLSRAMLDGFAVAKLSSYATVECTALAQPRLHRSEFGTYVLTLFVSCRSLNDHEELPCRTRTKVLNFS